MAHVNSGPPILNISPTAALDRLMPMYRFTIEVAIDAPVERVWRALCDPAEVVQWDGGVIEALDAPPDYPAPGQVVHWRYRSRLFKTLVDRPQEVEAQRMLRSLLARGPFRYDETYGLSAKDDGTELSVEVQGWTTVPLIGRLIDRAYAGPIALRAFDGSLAAIKEHCESEP